MSHRGQGQMPRVQSSGSDLAVEDREQLEHLFTSLQRQVAELDSSGAPSAAATPNQNQPLAAHGIPIAPPAAATRIRDSGGAEPTAGGPDPRPAPAQPSSPPHYSPVFKIPGGNANTSSGHGPHGSAFPGPAPPAPIGGPSAEAPSPARSQPRLRDAPDWDESPGGVGTSQNRSFGSQSASTCTPPPSAAVASLTPPQGPATHADPAPMPALATPLPNAPVATRPRRPSAVQSMQDVLALIGGAIAKPERSAALNAICAPPRTMDWCNVGADQLREFTFARDLPGVLSTIDVHEGVFRASQRLASSYLGPDWCPPVRCPAYATKAAQTVVIGQIPYAFTGQCVGRMLAEAIAHELARLGHSDTEIGGIAAAILAVRPHERTKKPGPGQAPAPAQPTRRCGLWFVEVDSRRADVYNTLLSLHRRVLISDTVVLVAHTEASFASWIAARDSLVSWAMERHPHIRRDAHSRFQKGLGAITVERHNGPAPRRHQPPQHASSHGHPPQAHPNLGHHNHPHGAPQHPPQMGAMVPVGAGAAPRAFGSSVGHSPSTPPPPPYSQTPPGPGRGLAPSAYLRPAHHPMRLGGDAGLPTPQVSPPSPPTQATPSRVDVSPLSRPLVPVGGHDPGASTGGTPSMWGSFGGAEAPPRH